MTKNDKDVRSWLIEMAHKADKEAITKIGEFMEETDEPDLYEWAKLAWEEAVYLYYTPENEDEIYDNSLARLVYQHEDILFESDMQREFAEEELVNQKIEKEVSEALQKKNIENQEEREMYSAEYCDVLEEDSKEYKAQVEYEQAWLEQAEIMFKTEKFKDIPFEVAEFLYSEDLDDEDCCDEDCCDEDCCDEDYSDEDCCS